MDALDATSSTLDLAGSAWSRWQKSSLWLLVIDGHPRSDSFGSALAEACHRGGRSRHAACRFIRLRDLEFDPIHREQPLEPDLQLAQRDLLWADIIVFVYPTWWGTMPALLKGFLDRILRPGFAFEERRDGGWQGLLGGRAALLVTTMDTPHWIYRWLLGAPGNRAMRDATLGFCGIHPIQILAFGPIRTSTQEQRRVWLARTIRAARTLEARFYSGWKAKLRAWLTVSRLNFYVEPWIAFTVGALAANAHASASLHWPVYLLGYSTIALLEFITVTTNELADLPTDRINANASMLTGGSRMLVTNRLSQSELRRGRLIAVTLLAAVLAGVWTLLPSAWPVMILTAIGLALGISYSAPPVRLSARGLGELDVAITHSFLVVLAGWISQGVSPFVATPSIIALPLGIAVLPSIILAAFPDFEADESTGKRTLAVRIGRRAAAIVAGTCAVVAALLPICLIGVAPTWHWWCAVPATAHAVWLCSRLRRYVQSGCPPGRIDGLLIIALTFMLWFCVLPLIALLAG